MDMEHQRINQIIDAQPESTSLQQAFYTDAGIYQRDVEAVFLKSWIYAGHVSEVPSVGDWFLFELAGESAIIVRSDADEISALINVCRHRGSRICTQQSGCSRKLVCRYHGWSYNLDGGLYSAAHMDEDFDKSAIKIGRAHV